MSSCVEIHNYNCPICNKITIANLYLDTREYFCLSCLNKKNKSHNRPINKDSDTSNIKPLVLKGDLSTREEKEKLKQTIKEFNKNLKDLGLI